MAVATLLALDAVLPAGLIPGSGSMAEARTVVFTTLVLAQLVNVFCSRSDEASAFRGLFANPWLWLAVVASTLFAAGGRLRAGLPEGLRYGATRTPGLGAVPRRSQRRAVVERDRQVRPAARLVAVDEPSRYWPYSFFFIGSAMRGDVVGASMKPMR